MPNRLNIKKLKLRNYRCFSEIAIEFHYQLTVLVAPNGKGKTAILDAIAVAFGPYIGAFDEATGKHFEPDDIRLIRARDTASNEMEYAAGGVSLEAEGMIPDKGMSSIAALDESWANKPWKRSLDEPKNKPWKRSLAGAKKKTTIKDAGDLIAYGRELQKQVGTPGSNVILPILGYYGTGRLWQQKKLTQGTLPRVSRTIGYRDCLDPASSYKSFAEWFRYWSTNALKGRIDAAQSGRDYAPTEFDAYIQSVADAVNTCLSPAGWKNISYSFAREDLVAHHDGLGELPVALLSDGIRNMIGMVADIAFRATKLNPQLGSSAARETPGIVWIDEIDMHLHPAWQQVVLDGLTKAFPSIQFIVTTHSPQVLTTVRKECIRVIEWEGDMAFARTPAHETYAQESRTTLEDVLGVSSRPPLDITNKLQDYLRRIEDGKDATPGIIQLRAELEKALGAGDEQLQLADMLIARNQAICQKGRA
ncbi:MAG: AAA family ATPase [Nitrosomonadales bacterium]|nr:AAA family ATPase [Nitrosomonadales bacterium]